MIQTFGKENWRTEKRAIKKDESTEVGLVEHFQQPFFSFSDWVKTISRAPVNSISTLTSKALELCEWHNTIWWKHTAKHAKFNFTTASDSMLCTSHNWDTVLNQISFVILSSSQSVCFCWLTRDASKGWMLWWHRTAHAADFIWCYVK